MDIKGAVAFVTGGAKGIGLAIATHLVDLGAKVIVADRDEAAMMALSQKVICKKMDATQPEDVMKVVGDVVIEHGRIDILVNNAGVIFSEPFVNILNPEGMMHSYGRFREALAANLDTVFIVTSAVVESMIKGRVKGVIVNMSSISAGGNEGQTAYSAAKAGVNSMTTVWSKELGRWGIRCNAVAPGFIDTESTHHALHESTLKHIQANTPLRRLGNVNNVAKAVSSLIENDFITGTVLNVNGGMTL